MVRTYLEITQSNPQCRENALSHQSVTIAVLSFNKPDLTARALNSIFSAYKSTPTPKVILFHNGSLSVNSDRLTHEFPTVEHVVEPLNRGFSGGANRALKAAFAHTDWALFLSNDCFLTRPIRPDDLVKSPALIALAIMRREQKKLDSLGGIYHSNRAHLSHIKDLNQAKVLFSKSSKSSKKIYVPGAAFLIHKEAFKKLNGFDESLGTYWEDVDLSLRAQDLGIPLGINDSLEINHGIGKTCHGKPEYTLYYYQRNRALVTRRHTAGLNRLFALGVIYFDWIKIGLRLLRAHRHDDIAFLKRAFIESLAGRVQFNSKV